MLDPLLSAVNDSSHLQGCCCLHMAEKDCINDSVQVNSKSSAEAIPEAWLGTRR
jgi:hypothetical protein